MQPLASGAVLSGKRISYEQQYFSAKLPGEISWGQELMTDDRVHSVRISRG